MKFKIKNNNNSNNVYFAHVGKVCDFYKFRCWMYGAIEAANEEEQKNFEAYYFAMCLLLPKEAFMREVNSLGGLKTVLCDNDKIYRISKIFKVEIPLVKVRINDFIKQQEEMEKEQLYQEEKPPVRSKVKIKNNIKK